MTALTSGLKYLQRRRAYPPLLQAPVPADLALVVVLPCYNEPDLLATLNSLWQAERIRASIEVLIVLNAPQNASDDVLAQNQRTREEFHLWQTSHSEPSLRFHLLEPPPFSRKHGGVGLARKTGMDEALHRFLSIENTEGIIVNLDADCTVEPSYFRAIFDKMNAHPEASGGHIYYEHPFEHCEDWQREAIVEYELFLRWYIHVFRYAGVGPYLHQTVGSTMVTRASAYAAIGGMNKRKAGEDFYFLQKLMAYGGFLEITDTCVYPSPRISDRVPFGTGRALQVMQAEERGWPAYNPRSVEELAVFVDGFLQQQQVTSKKEFTHWLESLPPAIKAFVKEDDPFAHLREIQTNTTTPESYRRRCFQWMNAFWVMKYFHYARDQFYPNVPIAEAVAWLQRQWKENSGTVLEEKTATEWLQELRQQDRAFGEEHLPSRTYNPDTRVMHKSGRTLRV